MNKHYWCPECKCEFDCFQTATLIEPYGESFIVCPHCKGDLEDMIVCDACGEYELEDNFVYDEVSVCKECIKQYSKKYSFCEKIAEEEPVNIPSVYAYCLSPDDIINALREYVKANDIDCEDFLCDNLQEFVRVMKEGVWYKNGKK